MKAVDFIIQKHFGEFIKSVFTEQLLSDKNFSDTSALYLAEQMKTKIVELNELANIKLEDSDVKRAILTFCEQSGITKNISNNNDISNKVILEVFNSGSELTSEFFDKLSFNILEAYKSGFDINRLYQPVNIENNLLESKNLIHEGVYEYLEIIKKSDLKEAIGVINTHLENSEYTNNEIKSAWERAVKKSPNNEDEQHKIFIRSIIAEVNNSSLTSEPFTINEKDNKFKLKFNRRTSGIYDHFTYSERTNRFGLNFSTMTHGTDIENDTIFRHSLSAIATLQYMNTWFANNDNYDLTDIKDIKKIINIISTGFKSEKEFRMAFQDNKYEKIFKKSVSEATSDNVDSSIKGINKKLNFFLQDLIIGFNTGKVNKIKTEKIMEMFDESNNSVDSFFDDTSYTHDTLIHINEKNIKDLLNNLNFKLDIFFFGDVKSKKKSKSNSYSENFTDEELRAGINILAYSGRHLEGVDGIRFSPRASVAFLENINYRFNTSTQQKYNCVDLTKLNSNIREIGGVFIDDFISNNDIQKVLRTYPNESDTILKNISLFEKNVLSQILEVMKESYCTPEKAFKSVMNNLKAKKDMDLESFLDVASTKSKAISDENYSLGNTFIIDCIKHKVSLHKNELNNNDNTNELQRLKDLLKQNDVKF